MYYFTQRRRWAEALGWHYEGHLRGLAEVILL